jgi:hypothetical protein
MPAATSGICRKRDAASAGANEWRSIMKYAIALVMLGLLATPPASAAPVGAPMPVQAPMSPLLTEPVQPMTPQLNNPGAQMAVPAPGNPVQQLAPLDSLRSPSGTLGIK